MNTIVAPETISTNPLRATAAWACAAARAALRAVAVTRQLAAERYLSESGTISELENRIRSIERGDRHVPICLRSRL